MREISFGILPMALGSLILELIMIPLRLFLGMLFLIGALAIGDKPSDAIAWVWGMNGLITVVGGLGSVLVSLLLGFNAAVCTALSLYELALLIFRPMRDSQFAPA